MPPAMPGSSSLTKSLRSTLPYLACAIPETPVVKSLAMCVLALATAGLAPVPSRKLLAVTP